MRSAHVQRWADVPRRLGLPIRPDGGLQQRRHRRPSGAQPGDQPILRRREFRKTSSVTRLLQNPGSNLQSCWTVGALAAERNNQNGIDLVRLHYGSRATPPRPNGALAGFLASRSRFRRAAEARMAGQSPSLEMDDDVDAARWQAGRRSIHEIESDRRPNHNPGPGPPYA